MLPRPGQDSLPELRPLGWLLFLPLEQKLLTHSIWKQALSPRMPLSRCAPRVCQIDMTIWWGNVFTTQRKEEIPQHHSGHSLAHHPHNFLTLDVKLCLYCYFITRDFSRLFRSTLETFHWPFLNETLIGWVIHLAYRLPIYPIPWVLVHPGHGVVKPLLIWKHFNLFIFWQFHTCIQCMRSMGHFMYHPELLKEKWCQLLVWEVLGHG